MKIKIVTVYNKEDIEFSDDYIGVCVYVNDQLVRRYDESYYLMANSFVDGLTYGMHRNEYSIYHENINSDGDL